ncbi:YihY family inner membrane protein [Hydrogenophaga aquatica]
MSETTRWAGRIDRARKQAEELWEGVRHFPWRNTAITLRERFREDRLAVTAGSLTFTTMISMVPLFTVALAIFSAFPMFSRMETMLQKWLVQSLVPENIARQVMNYLVQFSNKAGQMGWLGALLLLVTALALILTIDRKLNDIWRVRQLRPLAQRVLVYWAVLTLGPFVLGLSLSLSSYAMSTSRGWVGGLHGGLLFLLDVLEFVLVIGALAALYRYVPHAKVRWPHAMLGGLFVWIGLELAKKLLAWYLVKVPTYSVVYGTFATVPILLVWIYLAWVTLLLGAVVTAYLPSLLSGIARRGDTPGWTFQLALEALDQLWRSRDAEDKGLSLVVLAQRLRVDPLQLEGPLETLQALDWVGKLAEEEERYVLLIQPEAVDVEPLVHRLLLPRADSALPFWQAARLAGLRLVEALPPR